MHNMCTHIMCMPNVTIAIEEDVLKRAKRYAEEHGTSVNGLIRDLLARTVGMPERRDLRHLFELMDRAKADGRGWRWNRDEAYDDV